MVKWLKFYFLGFFNDKYGKEAASRSMLNVLLSLLLTLLLLSGGISAGYSASFGKHYNNADEFRSFLYSNFAVESSSRIELKIQNGRLDSKIPNADRINTFQDGRDGYKLILDTNPAETSFDDFTLTCKDANGIEISYEDYLKLPETGKENGSVVFNYSGKPLDVTVKQVQYIEYLDNLSNETGKDYNSSVALSYGELKHKKSIGEISDAEYADEIYILYAKTYYPSYERLEIYGKAPTLRTYYMQAELTEGEEEYLILLDDICICAFMTKAGIAVNFGSYYTGIADTVISADGMTAGEIKSNIDGFMENGFSGGGSFNFLVHLMNMGRTVLLLILVILALSLLVFILCKVLRLEYGNKFFGAIKITASYLLYSGLVSFFLAIILSFFCSRGTVFTVIQAVAIGIVVLRTLALFITELIRNKAVKPDSV